MTSSNGNIFRVTVWGTHRWHKCQWRRALMFSMICACKNGWLSNREAGDLRRHRAHYDVTVMLYVDIDKCLSSMDGWWCVSNGSCYPFLSGNLIRSYRKIQHHWLIHLSCCVKYLSHSVTVSFEGQILKYGWRKKLGVGCCRDTKIWFEAKVICRF